ncbi:MAG: M48 family metallopeptidase [Propionibacteriaceae bacterium]|nr:M48 family metallopeptidase [Propionibacteriaceae bacterium]
MSDEPYEIRTSARRTRTMSAFREGGRVVVVMPARLSARQRAEAAGPLVERFLAQEENRRPPRADRALQDRASELFDQYVWPHVEGARPEFGVRWVSNMERRWGSCTPGTGEIRVSDRLRAMPAWVVDHVLVHELAHLVERHHTARFRRIEGGYPQSERAQGFLDGWDAALHAEEDRPAGADGGDL